MFENSTEIFVPHLLGMLDRDQRTAIPPKLKSQINRRQYTHEKFSQSDSKCNSDFNCANLDDIPANSNNTTINNCRQINRNVMCFRGVKKDNRRGLKNYICNSRILSQSKFFRVTYFF